MIRHSPDTAPQGTPRDPLIGSVLQGRYLVRRRIGKGGMGVVYLGEHVLIRRKVAIKTLHANPPPAPAVVERFHREALAATAIGDQHIVDVTDMGQLEDGAYYLVMEYLEGADLAFTVASAGALPIARAVRIVLQLCDALTAVHAAGIVHRDLKPENLFLIERQGVPDFVKVLDFGVCKLTQAHDGSFHRLTGTGAALGTPHFMAPEQIEGRADVDHRADIYAVGGILFNALTGDAPFDATSLPRLFMRICNDPAPRLRERREDVPEALEAVVAKTLAKDPADRYQDSQELKRALAPFAQLPEQESAEPAPIKSVTRIRAPQRANVTDVEWVTLEGRRRWPLRAVLTGVLLLAAALGAGLWSAQRSRETVAPAAERARGSRAGAHAAKARAPRPAAEARPTAETVPPGVELTKTAGGDAAGTGPAAATLPPARPAQASPRARGTRVKAPAGASQPSDGASTAAPHVEPPAAASAEPEPPPANAPARPSEPLLPARELKHVF
ncbi:MAG TPA: serine/threonine-protein kinase [Polyangiales bacterium]|nr:serine/threonine-protein kinase [Polyangiales bacterium]